MKELNVKVEGEVKTITILEGQALPQREPKIININGTISAPFEFIEKRKDKYDESEVSITYDRNKMEIVLRAGDQNYFGATITGKLEINPDLKKFNINEQIQTSIPDMTRFLKLNKYFFADPEQSMKVISNLQKFSASIKTQLDQQLKRKV